jgi:flagellin
VSSVINTNMFSIYAQREMNLVERTEERTMERITSGARINRAADDAAGVALMHKASAQITGYTQTVRNSNDGITMSQVADQAMGDITNVLQRMRELSLQSTSKSFSDDDRDSMQVEFSVLQGQIKGVINDTVFNGIPVINRPDDQLQQTIDLHVGGNYSDLTLHHSVDSLPLETEIRGYYTGVGLTGSGGEDEYTIGVADDRTFEIEIDGIALSPIALNPGTQTPAEWAATLQQQINDDPALVAEDKSVKVYYDETLNRFAFLSDSTEADSSVKMLVVGSDLGKLSIIPSAVGATGQDKVISLIGIPEAERQLSFSVDGQQPVEITLPEYVRPAVEWGYYLNGAIDGADTSFDATTQKLTIVSEAGDDGSISLSTRGGAPALGLVVHDTSKVEMDHFDMDDPTNALGMILRDIEKIDTQSEGEAMLGKIDAAMIFIDQGRSHYGAVANRLENLSTYLDDARVDSFDVRSRIEDADFAAESATLARSGIMKQVTTAMMAQANQMPEQMLQLFN